VAVKVIVPLVPGTVPSHPVLFFPVATPEHARQNPPVLPENMSSLPSDAALAVIPLLSVLQ
jgi:hypothetical protein